MGHFSDSLWTVAFSFVSTRIAVSFSQGLCKDYLVSTGKMLNTASVVQLRIQSGLFIVIAVVTKFGGKVCFLKLICLLSV